MNLEGSSTEQPEENSAEPTPWPQPWDILSRKANTITDFWTTDLLIWADKRVLFQAIK